MSEDFEKEYGPGQMSRYKKTADRVLVVGNGFDMGLGLKTSYKDFANSKFWPFNDESLYPKGTLAFMLNQNKQLDRWFDLEELFYEYASITNRRLLINNGISDIVSFDKECVKILTNKLAEYLREEQEKKEIEKEILSAVVLRYFLETYPLLYPNETVRIYSFNYTDIQLLSKKIGIDEDIDCVHVHGSLKDNSCILGVGDKRELKEPYFFLHKSAHPMYKSNQLISDLCNAKEIIIYGHSLGDNDHDYFNRFFIESAEYINEDKRGTRIITIFTRDENSKLDIKRKLMKLTNRSLTSLFNHCLLDIICVTDDKDRERFIHRFKDVNIEGTTAAIINIKE